MKWKVVNNSETRASEEPIWGKCPVTGEDVCVTSKFNHRQVCSKDLQKTPMYSGYRCSLHEKIGKQFPQCIECPLIQRLS